VKPFSLGVTSFFNDQGPTVFEDKPPYKVLAEIILRPTLALKSPRDWSGSFYQVVSRTSYKLMMMKSWAVNKHLSELLVV